MPRGEEIKGGKVGVARTLEVLWGSPHGLDVQTFEMVHHLPALATSEGCSEDSSMPSENS